MHVLIIPSWYPTESNPIAGVFFKEHAHALQKYGHEVTVAFLEIWSVTTIGRHGESAGLSVVIEDGLPTYRYRAYNFLPKVPDSAKRLYYKKLKKTYQQIIKERGKPDLIHAHSCFLAGWAGSKLAAEENIPSVITEHSSAFARNLVRPDQMKYMKEGFQTTDRVIAVGPGLKKELAEYVPNNEIEIIPNIVNTDDFYPGNGQSAKDEKISFFSVAFLSHNKGMDLLLKAFSKSFKDKNVELIIGGDGEEKPNLERLAKELAVDEQVRFLGGLSRNEVREQMQRCDAFVLASRYETFGVVYIEALACGKPIIATACGGPDMIVNEKNGLLVPTEDVDSLGEAMKHIAGHLEEYDPEVIRQDCIDRFSEQSVVNQINKVYQTLMHR